MPTSAVYFAIFASISQLPPVSHATWAPGKAAQINFFTDDICSQYNGEVAAWWTMTPMIGGTGSMATYAECILLSMNGNSQSTGVADVYEATAATTTTLAPHANGSCTFWDGLTCTGNEASSNYRAGSGVCMPARSKDGVRWQSAKCQTLIRRVQCCSRLTDAKSPGFFLEALPQGMSSVGTNTKSSTSIASVSISSLPSVFIHWNPYAQRQTHFTNIAIQHISPGPIAANLAVDLIVQYLHQPSFLLDPDKPSAPTQSPVHAMKKTVSASTIAGLTVGAATTLILIAILAFCTWRARRRREILFPTQGYLLPPAGQHRPAVHQKLGADPIATELRTSRQDLRRNNVANGDESTNLDLAMRQTNIIEARIRALERAYGGPQVLDSSLALPPRYQDVALADTTTARPGH
ncbi:hypothetical protein B0H19DRAFT_1083855 [Mycena capillaripes]|nr:hypothetical protein B0H19DRAFT_1083855 [Mycena capillaripes]